MLGWSDHVRYFLFFVTTTKRRRHPWLFTARHTLTSPGAIFRLSCIHAVLLSSHCIDAGRATAQYALGRGHSLFIVVGGEHEQVRRVGLAGC